MVLRKEGQISFIAGVLMIVVLPLSTSKKTSGYNMLEINKRGDVTMKIVNDALLGLLAIIGITIFEFILTIPFGEPNPDTITKFINFELLLTAVPAILVTFLLAWLFKTKSKSEALNRSITWTIVVAIWYLVVALGNDNFKNVFGQIGIYVLLFGCFLGPMILWKVRGLK